MSIYSVTAILLQRSVMSSTNAIISLTSWKARITTVGLTLFSLLKWCPGFRIVLCLSTEEFPGKEDELPNDLRAMLSAGLLEILWTGKNVKSFKKWIFTAQRYPTIPIISADDDCIYQRNYANELYQAWIKNPLCCYTIHKCPVSGFQHGPATLYPPGVASNFMIEHLTENVLRTAHDDVFYGMCLNKLNIPIIEISRTVPYVFHDTTGALSDGITMNLFKSMTIISHEI